MPLYEYINETVGADGRLLPATHIPRPVSSCPYVIELIAAFPLPIRARDPRMGCQFNPSVEYTIFAQISTLLAVPGVPPATNNPFPNAQALHCVNNVSEFGTSLQLIPS